MLSRVLPFFQALPYVALLIAMLFFIYAVIGMQVSPAPQGPVCSVVPDLGQDAPPPGGMESHHGCCLRGKEMRKTWL